MAPNRRRSPILLVLGGVRSGKSAYAERRARETGLERVYLATSQVFDDEMQERVSKHRTDRAGDGWTTVEEPLALHETLAATCRPDRIVLVDCLTLWVTNLMMAERDVPAEIAGLAEALESWGAGPIVFVTNEVGLGIVPDNAMARAFRDHAGRLNQAVAVVADEVVFVAAGLPLTLKGGQGSAPCLPT